MKFFGYLDDLISKSYYKIRYWWLYSVLKKPKPLIEKTILDTFKMIIVSGLIYNVLNAMNDINLNNSSKKTNKNKRKKVKKR